MDQECSSIGIVGEVYTELQGLQMGGRAKKHTFQNNLRERPQIT